MKLYNKLWVPDEKGHYKLQEFYEDHHEYIDCHEGSLGERTGVIVCSIEELREIWDAAQDRANALASGFPEDTMIFETYLQSKGITL